MLVLGARSLSQPLTEQVSTLTSSAPVALQKELHTLVPTVYAQKAQDLNINHQDHEGTGPKTASRVSNSHNPTIKSSSATRISRLEYQRLMQKVAQ